MLKTSIDNDNRVIVKDFLNNTPHGMIEIILDAIRNMDLNNPIPINLYSGIPDIAKAIIEKMLPLVNEWDIFFTIVKLANDKYKNILQYDNFGGYQELILTLDGLKDEEHLTRSMNTDIVLRFYKPEQPSYDITFNENGLYEIPSGWFPSVYHPYKNKGETRKLYSVRFNDQYFCLVSLWNDDYHGNHNCDRRIYIKLAENLDNEYYYDHTCKTFIVDYGYIDLPNYKNNLATFSKLKYTYSYARDIMEILVSTGLVDLKDIRNISTHRAS